MKDYELAQMSLEELLDPIVERRLREFTPEQLAKTLTPEQLTQMFTPEQLAKTLTPEQLVKTLEALPPEVWEQIKQRMH